MKKAAFATLGLASILMLVGGTATANATPLEEDTVVGIVTVKITDLETGEVVFEETNTQEHQVSAGEGILEVDSQMLDTESPLISPFASKEQTQDNGAVITTLKLTYTAQGEQIRLENVSGSWTPKLTSYVISDREVHYGSGGALPVTGHQYPTTNSYSYNTGFGWADRHGSPTFSPGATSEMRYTLAGTGHAGFLKTMHFTLAGE